MKNLKLTSFLLILLAFSSCKKDKVEENPSRTIVGKWYLKKVIETTYMDGVKKEEAPSTNFGSEDYLEFKADGSGNISEDGDKDAFSYKILSDNQLQLIYEGETEADATINITKLTAADLVLFIDQSETYQNVKYRYTSELTLKK